MAGKKLQKSLISDFEVYVIDQIRAMGCKPVPQVGVAGYFVDIGILGIRNGLMALFWV